MKINPKEISAYLKNPSNLDSIFLIYGSNDGYDIENQMRENVRGKEQEKKKKEEEEEEEEVLFFLSRWKKKGRSRDVVVTPPPNTTPVTKKL